MKKQPEKENGERWLLTYSDLITLLMILFVVMYAMSNVDQAKYAQLASSLNSAMGSGGGSPNMIGAGGPSTAVVGLVDSVALDGAASEAAAQAEKTKLEGIKKQVDAYLDKNGLSGSASATIQERGLAISIKDTLIFDSGKAILKVGTDAKIIEIGKLLASIDNYINVEGNTDSVAINTDAFQDNWSLASVRAENVMRVLIKSGIQPAKISSKSNGEYRPIASNDTADGKAANRRVDIVILDNKFSTSESAKTK